ncbi:conserved hypothetical protein [Streptomyces sp. SPB78]|nr:conserved hypothetical protein [Streptomyces sp. SPB78]
MVCYLRVVQRMDTAHGYEGVAFPSGQNYAEALTAVMRWWPEGDLPVVIQGRFADLPLAVRAVPVRATLEARPEKSGTGRCGGR